MNLSDKYKRICVKACEITEQNARNEETEFIVSL